MCFAQIKVCLFRRENGVLKRIWGFVFFILCTFSCWVYADEEESAMLENNISVEDIKEDILTYEEIAEGIVCALNERDSYFYEIVNPTDILKYLESMGVHIPVVHNNQITRLDFCKLYLEIAGKMGDAPYQTNLIKIEEIFNDLEELDDIDKEVVKVVFIEGLLAGVAENKFNPYGEITRNQLNIILERVKNGYSRSNLFNIVDSLFIDEEREKILNGEEDRNVVFADLNTVFSSYFEAPKNVEGTEEIVLIYDFLDWYSVSVGCGVIKKDTITGEFYYPAKDTAILSAEEWEYLNTHLDRPILYSEALILCERIVGVMLEIDILNFFDCWEEVDRITGKYLPFAYSVVVDYRRCMEYFMADSFDENVTTLDRGDFSRAIHEAQHEGSATLSKAFVGRRKSENSWQIRWGHKPTMYYYFDFTNGNWVDSRSLFLPYTSVIYNKRCSEGVKGSKFLKYYVTDNDLIANTYGLQGLLQEFASYALQSKVEFVCTSLNINKRSIRENYYNNYIFMKYMVIESLDYIKETQSMQYESFMQDIDMVRFLNNVFKEMDYYEKVYAESLDTYAFLYSWFSDAVIEWGIELGVPLTFIT